jgi:hypothetical protein
MHTIRKPELRLDVNVARREPRHEASQTLSGARRLNCPAVRAIGFCCYKFRYLSWYNGFPNFSASDRHLV